mmetsp:Transcript_69810/g.227099  ORF Transcript_69810/g.227099 Transcript_69810/m.227099 type:complete len:265 (-) Transcript_69810:169-963(-)
MFPMCGPCLWSRSSRMWRAGPLPSLGRRRPGRRRPSSFRSWRWPSRRRPPCWGPLSLHQATRPRPLAFPPIHPPVLWQRLTPQPLAQPQWRHRHRQRPPSLRPQRRRAASSRRRRKKDPRRTSRRRRSRLRPQLLGRLHSGLPHPPLQPRRHRPPRSRRSLVPSRLSRGFPAPSWCRRPRVCSCRRLSRSRRIRIHLRATSWCSSTRWILGSCRTSRTRWRLQSTRTTTRTTDDGAHVHHRQVPKGADGLRDCYHSGFFCYHRS